METLSLEERDFWRSLRDLGSRNWRIGEKEDNNKNEGGIPYQAPKDPHEWESKHNKRQAYQDMYKRQ